MKGRGTADCRGFLGVSRLFVFLHANCGFIFTRSFLEPSERPLRLVRTHERSWRSRPAAPTRRSAVTRRRSTLPQQVAAPSLHSFQMAVCKTFGLKICVSTSQLWIQKSPWVLASCAFSHSGEKAWLGCSRTGDDRFAFLKLQHSSAAFICSIHLQQHHHLWAPSCCCSSCGFVVC